MLSFQPKLGLLALVTILALCGIASADSVVTFNEIMYHPATDEAGLEWIELRNQMSYDMDISLWKLRGGIEFDFPTNTLVPGNGYLVVASSPSNLTTVTGCTNVIGPFTGQLGNSGEEIRLRNNSGRLMDVVSYGDGGKWPVAPDGSGVSLAKPYAPTASDDPANWSWSASVNGTPGSNNVVGAGNSIAFNEVEKAWAGSFWLEIMNRGSVGVGVGGFSVRCAGSVTGEYTLASQTLAPGDFVVVTGVQLGLTPADEDRLFLFTPGNTVADAVVVENRHRGRYPDGTGDWMYPDAGTSGSSNSFSLNTGIVINEIMYAHQPLSYEPYVESPEEWIELYNRGASTVNLEDWRFTGAISFNFPAGTIMDPGDYLVIANNAASLSSNFPAAPIIGNFSGRLNDRGEELVLEDVSGNPADRVRYYDRGWWPSFADAGGSSMELRDPDADNSSVSAWTASDEGALAGPDGWHTYEYTTTAVASIPAGPDSLYHELVIGLLDSGEVLLDDISVIEDPAGTATEFIQNGSFEGDTPGGGAYKWRIIGNHQNSEVIVDPDNGANKVLRLVAGGATEHMSNHAETTFTNSYNVTIGKDYKVSFKAKAIGGSPQLNTRLFFNRCARTTIIDRSPTNGTPGTQNSRYESNIGPTYSDFIHSPAVPAAMEPVTVSVHASDPDGIANMTTWYSTSEGATWNSASMTHQGDGLYEGTIPGQSAATIVQFYVKGTDGLAATSVFPPDGTNSRALFKVDDGWATSNGRNNFRIIMLNSEATWMRSLTNLMSNDRLPCTVIYNEEHIHYDAGVRHKGSDHHRLPDNEVGFVVTFQADNLFRGVLSSVGVDRTQGVGFGQRELLDNLVMNHSGGKVSRYTDFIKVLAPLAAQTGSAELQMARYGSMFLAESFENGDDGTVFEAEFIYNLTPTDTGTPEGNKQSGTSGGVATGPGFGDFGPDKEIYRYAHIIKNNQRKDDYARYMEWLAVMGQANPTFNQQIGDYMDVDVFLRSMASAVSSGCGDNFAQNAGHNCQFYVRPEDQRVLFFPHDMDAFHSATASMYNNTYLNKLVLEPANRRLYLSHMNNILDVAYNTNYISHWTEQLTALSDEQDFDTFRTFIGTRHDYLRGQIDTSVEAQYPFAVTTAPQTVGTPTITVDGDGWIDVYEIRLAGRPGTLPLTWTDSGGPPGNHYYWHTEVPLDPGTNDLVFLACNYQGDVVGSNDLQIVSTAEEQALADALRISEIMYHPAVDGDLEFIELLNTSTSSLNIASVMLDNAVDFSFAGSAVTNLGPGEYVVVVRDLVKFATDYDTNGILVAGEYSGGLANGGETIRLEGLWTAETLFSIGYDDERGWPLAADGAGHSLVPLYIEDQTNGILDYGGNWRPSAFIGGSPGGPDPVPITNILLNEIVAHTDYTNDTPPLNEYDSNDKIELYNATGGSLGLADWYLSDSSDDLKKWKIPGTNVIATTNFLWLEEISHFHFPKTNGFGIRKSGDDIYLSYLPGTTNDRVADCVSFKGQENGPSLGRHPDGTPWWNTFTGPSTNAANMEEPVHVTINEVMYHPLTNASFPSNNVNDEFIEIYNGTVGPVPLWNDSGVWRLDGVGYAFPTNVTLAPKDAILIVSFDPSTNTAAKTAFLDAYGLDEGDIRLFGPYAGALNDRGERIALERPQDPDLPDPSISWVIVDEIIYFDQAPWTPDADGTGNSLRRVANGYKGSGNDPESWFAGDPNPGLPEDKVAILQPLEGDAFYIPFTTTIKALPFTDFPVTQVEFFANGSSVGLDTTEPYEATWGTGTTDGFYALHSVLTDTEGAHTSQTVNVYIYGPPNSTWARRTKISTPGYDRSATLTNFPMLVRFSEVLTNSLYSEFAYPVNASDLRFASGNLESALPYEVEKWNTNGTSYVWVRIPELTNGTSIWAYWGNPAASNAPWYRTDGSVWSEGFEGVWHLGSSTADSTLKRTAWNFGSTNVPGGPGGDCQGFDGANDYIQPGLPREWFTENVSNLTINTWARPAGPGDQTVFGSKDEGASPAVMRKLHIKQTAGGYWDFGVGFLYNATTHQVDSNEWQMLSLVCYTNLSQTLFAAYKNGIAAPPTFRTGSTLFDYDPTIGRMAGESSPAFFFNGQVDEFRVSGVERSSDWLWAVWTNMTPGSTFLGYGEVEDTPGSGFTTNGIPHVWLTMHGLPTVGSDELDPDNDGLRTLREYIAGTDPTDASSLFSLSVLLSNGEWVVSFPAIEAQGTGYTDPANDERFYDLETRTNLLLGNWVPIVDYTNLPGNNTEIVHTNLSPRRIYYRARTRLE